MTPLRPRLRRSVDPRRTANGDLYILRGPDHGDLHLRGQTDVISTLLERADGTRTTEALVSELGESERNRRELTEAVAALHAEGVLDDAADEEAVLADIERERFHRQLAYFADLTGDAHSAAVAQRRLGQATVCMLGMGGLGSWIAWALVCAGVGRLTAVDGDDVEMSNLNRQILYTENDIATQKVVAAGRRLTAFRRALKYTPVPRTMGGADEIREVISGVDFVVDSLDRPPHAITRWVAAACFAEDVPYIAVSQHPPLLRVGPLYVPGQTGCYGCQEARYSQEFPLFESLRTSTSLNPPSATYGPACGVVGTLAANEIAAWLTGLHRPASLGRSALVDLRTLAVEFEPVQRAERCSLCGGRRGRHLVRAERSEDSD